MCCALRRAPGQCLNEVPATYEACAYYTVPKVAPRATDRFKRRRKAQSHKRTTWRETLRTVVGNAVVVYTSSALQPPVSPELETELESSTDDAAPLLCCDCVGLQGFVRALALQ
eukprot:1195381-Prorocentrum_minimum.AAC.1